MSQHLLSTLLGLPLLAAFVVLFTPRQMVGFIRAFTVLSMVVVFGLSLGLLEGNFGSAAMQFVEKRPLVPAYGITYSVGIDGMSVWLILLTTFIVPLATYASWTHIDSKIKEYAISLLVLETVMLGAFFALDLFLFYVFWELMLVPMLLIIGIWGGPQRVYAAVKFFLFTMVGSMLMLVAILYTVHQYKEVTGQYSFELADLKYLLLPVKAQVWCFSAFALAFAIKVPMFPFHTWLPDAHVQAPTGGSVILAAVMLKMGTYGFLRFAMPLFPAGSHQLSATIAMIAVIGIIYGAYCAWAQPDVKKLVAYSSVSHLGFVMLGIYSLNTSGVSGSILQMINHGISTGALFLLVGVIYERRHTRDLSEFGGLAKVMPNYALVFVIVTMSSVGLPATNGFVGEFMILAGTFMSEHLGRNGPIAATVAATGVILAAVYMLHAVLKMFWGPLKNPANHGLADLTRREWIALAPLVVLIFVVGLYPRFMLGDMQASVDRFKIEYTAKLRASDDDPTQRGLLKGKFVPRSELAAANRPAGGTP
ncbi:MAG TPA: NADH-quinone oxidoreductase subunit M [Polyangiales bacterium]|jgi:NADH-quinone oxidoreductase subunit M|nr:NADH-quinone oxidoreductase subunit M [Polyangiales bacterium]